MKNLYKYRRLAGIFLLAGAVTIGVNSLETTPEKEMSETIYIVKPGDTLWGIARNHCSKEDNILAFIHEIKSKNNIDNIDTELSVGQKIKIGSRPHESQSLNLKSSK